MTVRLSLRHIIHLFPKYSVEMLFYTYSIVILKVDTADSDIYRLAVEEQSGLSLIKKVTKGS